MQCSEGRRPTSAVLWKGTLTWPGFRVERSVCLERDRSLVCVCSVRESARGPLLVVEKRAEEEGLGLVVAGWTMTGVVRRFLELVLSEDDQKSESEHAQLPQIKRPHFFGLHFKQARRGCIPTRHGQPTCICEDVDEDEQTNQLIDDLDGLNATGGTLVRWNGIMSLGQPADPDQETRTTIAFRGKTLAFREGFTTSREVLTESGKWITIISQVVKSGSLPAFDCKAEVDGQKFSRQSHSVYSAVQSILRAVKAKTRRNWSAELHPVIPTIFFIFAFSDWTPMLNWRQSAGVCS